MILLCIYTINDDVILEKKKARRKKKQRNYIIDVRYRHGHRFLTFLSFLYCAVDSRIPTYFLQLL